MQPRVVFAVIAAVGTGAAIALQASLNGRVGTSIGAVRTGLLVNTAGGLIGALVFSGIVLIGRVTAAGASEMALSAAGLGTEASDLRHILLLLAAAGLLGVGIITGISFSVGSLGVTAGLAAVLLSQLVVGLFIDSASGLSGVAIALSVRRVLGVLAMAVGVWLLLPRAQ